MQKKKKKKKKKMSMKNWSTQFSSILSGWLVLPNIVQNRDYFFMKSGKNWMTYKISCIVYSIRNLIKPIFLTHLKPRSGIENSPRVKKKTKHWTSKQVYAVNN